MSAIDLVDRLNQGAPSIPAMRDGAEEIMRLRAEREALRTFIKATRCPDRNCNNKGSIQFFAAGGKLESEPCEWCAKRALLTGSEKNAEGRTE